jgi:hypothetical protein
LGMFEGGWEMGEGKWEMGDERRMNFYEHKYPSDIIFCGTSDRMSHPCFRRAASPERAADKHRSPRPLL